MKIIIPIVGIIKLIFSLIIFVGCFSAAIDSGFFRSNFRALLFPVSILSIVVGIYLNYSIQTAIWNLVNKAYRGNLPLIVGVIIHLIFMIYSASDFVRFYAIDKVILVMPFIFIGFLIGVYDIQKLFKSWN
ncbi:MAG TPA: hypothetical protein VG101_13070 [Puia sp.]|jgi:hypothetical protein|nr:hypothetical protein [Puia sp.]